ncbi:hypothetical protein HFP89_07225 [Wenzhouxiangella sp. XN79A]|uniref:MAPEG family protein n=1 Tax=Wenzhouxiangella sp. XN79A TaxID=2724193 RepID=UPI00144A9CF6|nr:MAPEG family protein [Wenzhouxiangella sp. XN79A]NKI34953.1 hypothetical protein [Wenzhouxiangella sp. XN79A]
MTPTITLFYAGLSALILLGLSARVVALRRKHQVGIGTGAINTLERAVRAQANFTEYVPLALLLIALLELQGVAGAVVHALGALLVIGRVLHALGLNRSAGTSMGRLVGTVLTWLVLLAGGAAALGVALIQGLG